VTTAIKRETVPFGSESVRHSATTQGVAGGNDLLAGGKGRDG
jgi:hypothetical protein